jgi:hypothetical protein
MNTEPKADIEDLSQYVAVNPGDNARRWTLAKKLYMAWEYNDALKHLLILKKNGTKKLNVLRYLAATYYRLGLYNEAIAELQEITRLWPSEVAVWEQLARVYEIAGRTADAAHTWEQVVRISPAHPTAARSVQRLRSTSDDARREDLRLRDSDSGIDISPYRICQNCGAQNSDEFDRCWQCHGVLRDEGPPIDSVHTARIPKSREWMWTFAGGMATVAAISFGLYITLTAIRRINHDIPSAYGPVYDVLAESLLVPRLVCALVLLIAWPFCISFGLRLAGTRPVRPQSLFGVGLFLAAVAYIAMWAPVPWLPYVALAPAVLSLALIVLLRAGRMSQGIAAWILHGLMIVPVCGGTFVALAGIQPAMQLPAILRYEAAMSSLATPGSIAIDAFTKSGERFVQWTTTGSSWLDLKGHRIVIEAEPKSAGAIVAMDLYMGTTSVSQPGMSQNAIAASIIPDTPYRLSVSLPPETVAMIRSRGVMQPVQNKDN